MALIVQCTSIPLPSPPPSINIPHFGALSKAWDSLHSIPKASDLLMKFQDNLALALAPVKRYLELVEVSMSLYNCTKAVPRAIATLNPGPIYDCLKALVKAIGLILSWMPPLAYVRMYMDLASYLIDLIDEIVALFQEFDSILTEYIETFTEATLLGDTELISILTCGASDIKARMVVVNDLLMFVKPANDLLIDVFIRLLPNEKQVRDLKKIKEKYQEANDYVESAQSALRLGLPSLPEIPGVTSTPPTQHELVPIPPIGNLVYSMGEMRNGMVWLYNLLAPIVGLDPDKQTREMPTFNNF